MTVNAFPVDRVHAPAAVVWGVPDAPSGYGGFWEMTVERVEPAGPAAVGQRFFAWTLCRRLRADVEILEVDAVQHAIRFHTTLPFGLVGANRILCSPIDADNCTLRYGCDFSFPPGWRRRLLNRFGGRVHASVADSLPHLKRAAELRARQAETGDANDGRA